MRHVLSNPQLFLNSQSDVRLLGPILAAAGGDLAAPTSDELQSDRDAFDIEPLFDGDVLERI